MVFLLQTSENVKPIEKDCLLNKEDVQNTILNSTTI